MKSYTSTKFLGVHTDVSLSMEVYVEFLSKNLCHLTFLIWTLKNSLPNKFLLTVYNGLVSSAITYAIIVWEDWAENETVFRLQRKTIRIINNMAYIDDCSNSFRSLKILALPSLYIYSSLLHARRTADTVGIWSLGGISQLHL